MYDLPPPFVPSRRLLLGPGPSEIHPSVLTAMAQPTLGHLDPELLAVQDELAGMLRQLFGTEAPWTFALSGTGSSGMECVLANLVRPGDAVLVGVCGYFGARLVEIARRHGGEVTTVEGAWGRALDPEALREAAGGKRFDVLAVVHAETSTGVLQELAPLRALADELGALLVADCVTSLGCVPVRFDERGLDAAYSCSQKGLSCPPGISPVVFSERARERVLARESAPRSWYLDAKLLMDYWGGKRGYHHTASSNAIVGLHEAARLALEEGLEARFARHRENAAALLAGLAALGLEPLAPPDERLPQLTTVRIPEGVSDADVRGRLLAEYGIEIGGGLGPLAGRIWRVGLMGAGSTRRNVLTALAALRAVLVAEGQPAPAEDDAIAAAQRAWGGGT